MHRTSRPNDHKQRILKFKPLKDLWQKLPEDKDKSLSRGTVTGTPNMLKRERYFSIVSYKTILFNHFNSLLCFYFFNINLIFDQFLTIGPQQIAVLSWFGFFFCISRCLYRQILLLC